ncbi:tetratricopeptide repeat protein [Actinocorallia sp. API 0066]|uniref:tetratricopeptide repeat protein n=1 Tax=Actinocorallia sp. API 0066 TaxID=2896846 RepID=UPI001E5C1F29|nr:tetratricopeptide repeat protein [Actinocorallia sp. API 0066]MCD0453517.1 tetratricopeptide repeat protein [Actinocorallia sp. API 0066]
MTQADGYTNRATAEMIGTLTQFRDLYGGMHLHLPEQRKERAVPRMLGPRNVHYTDREDQLAALDAARARAIERGVPLVAVCLGPDGIGKSELVTEWLGRIAHDVPGPHLYADMNETGPVTAKEVLGRFLRLMGEPPEDLPDDLAELTGLFRTRTHGVPSIVFLDNVVLTAQARPLLPDTPGSVMVVTARGLDGTLRGAVPVPLGRMADAAVLELVARVAGFGVAADPRSGELAAALDGSPLRAFTAGMQLALGQPLAELVGELRGPASAPDEPTGLLDAAYRRLSPDAARVYRALVGLLRRRFTVPMAAAAAGLDDAAAPLAEVVAAGLVRVEGSAHVVDTVTRKHLDGLVAEAEKEAALGRVVDWYLAECVKADYSAMPKRWHLGEAYTAYKDGPPPLTEADAMAWLEDEMDAVLAAVRAASARGWHRHVVRLAEAQWALCLKRKPYDHWRACYELGVLSATELATEGTDARFLGRMHCGLGFAHLGAGRIDDAVAAFTAARAADAAAGHVRGLATAVESLGLALLARSGAELLPDLRARDADAASRALAALEENRSINLSVPASLADARATVLAERHVGRALSATGDHARALACLETARHGFAALDDRYNLGKTMVDHGQALIRADRLTDAAPVLREALELLRADESPAEVVRALETISVLTHRGGDPEGAALWLDLALENLRARSHPHTPTLESRKSTLTTP